MLFQAEQAWRVGTREADGEQDSELTAEDTSRGEVKCLVWKKMTVDFQCSPSLQSACTWELEFSGSLGYCM